MEKNKIIIKGARENNLKDVDLTIPKNKLVVMTGVSGSGKSSLAFNTIYAEGQRRYMESLSAYARQFLGNSEKPDVDSIEGLSPAISIDQKSTSHNPRSTVGTITEIYDYLRLLYARIGKVYCPKHKILIERKSITAIVKEIFDYSLDDKIMILAPLVEQKKGTHDVLLKSLKKEGFLRVLINDEIYNLDEEIKLNKNNKYNIAIVVDRIVLKKEDRSRLYEAIELGIKYSNGLIKINNLSKKTNHLFSQNLSCKKCDFSVPNLEPRFFSFNSPAGFCQKCHGLGFSLKADINLLIPNFDLSIAQGGIRYFKNIVNTQNIEWQMFAKICEYYNIDIDMPLKSIDKNIIKQALKGTDEMVSYVIESKSGSIFKRYDFIEGPASAIERRYFETKSKSNRNYYSTFMSNKECPQCFGKRLNYKALAVRVGDFNIYEFCNNNIKKALDIVNDLKLDESDAKIANLVLKEITNRLQFLFDVGLSYLALNRASATLSGGESQRIRLATQIGSKLTGVLYVLDEPSIGLHQRDNLKLISTLKHMRDLGNTLIVVEHDEETILEADHVVDIGPLAGEKGGELVVQGTPKEIIATKESLIGQYLSGKKQILVPAKRRKGNNKFLQIKKAQENNLKKINVKIPLGKIIGITGVSGSGKSTLINQILYPALNNNLSLSYKKVGKHEMVLGMQNIDRIINISQDPIGRTPRSNPATYTSVFDDIRDIFARTNLAKERGYLKGRFSFNVPGGRCEKCQGDGVIKIEMHFLPDVYITCEECLGKRYNNETLDVRYKGKNIADILALTAEQALHFFENQPKLKTKLKAVVDVGLSYIKLGQSATTLSGGEAQRVKLAKELQKKGTGKTLYILDEPTTGLHIDDISKLINVLNTIVNKGDTIITIEHNLEVIKICDYLIDLGPEGGDLGGQVVAVGTPEQVAKNPKSYTGKFLKKML